ncbi:CPBP family intramembrane glutamic endopeptidase [Dactylosporangium cerinum]|uniref:CPBP family intramembrane glutamic endopeptidase n=1 Tax=Dactylosporangium cerinum TaxID=1434730 RepID=A0ABV9WIJ3_9ACTN
MSSSGQRTAPAGAVVLTVALMATVAAAGRLGPPHTMLIAGPAGALLLVEVARRAGLHADDLGLSRRSWRSGAAYAGICAAAVAVTYTVAALAPVTRGAFRDERYATAMGTAVLTALVVVPLGTVLFEEFAFRGVLWGLVRSRRGPAQASIVSSVLFGLWHILPSLRLGRVNPAVARLVGPGPTGQVLAVAGAVAFTTVAGFVLCELRRRSGSLLAPIGLHWAVNGFGVLATAGAAR